MLSRVSCGDARACGSWFVSGEASEASELRSSLLFGHRVFLDRVGISGGDRYRLEDLTRSAHTGFGRWLREVLRGGALGGARCLVRFGFLALGALLRGELGEAIDGRGAIGVFARIGPTLDGLVLEQLPEALLDLQEDLLGEALDLVRDIAAVAIGVVLFHQRIVALLDHVAAATLPHPKDLVRGLLLDRFESAFELSLDLGDVLLHEVRLFIPVLPYTHLPGCEEVGGGSRSYRRVSHESPTYCNGSLTPVHFSHDRKSCRSARSSTSLQLVELTSHFLGGPERNLLGE